MIFDIAIENGTLSDIQINTIKKAVGTDSTETIKKGMVFEDIEMTAEDIRALSEYCALELNGGTFFVL